MKKTTLPLTIAILAVLIAPPCIADHQAQADEPANLAEALKKGTATINLRYRYENVDDAGDKDAHASTLRTTLAYATAERQRSAAGEGIVKSGKLVSIEELLGPRMVDVLRAGTPPALPDLGPRAL